MQISKYRIGGASNFIMKIMSALALGGYFVRKHNEEAPLFIKIYIKGH